MQIPHSCTLCPRQCGADRTRQKGACGAANQLRIARAALHHWEEPCISGTRGSGTVFFSGCSLRCCYCQNHPISQQGVGKNIDEHRLAEIFLYLQSQGAHNINLVTASQWLPWVIEALQIARSQGLNLPVVYNTSGYETLETIQRLEGLVDIWLTDIKYVSSQLSGQYSFAKDYFQVCSQAVQAMIQQVGAPIMDEAGLMKRGVILRHLALPGHLEDSRRVLDFMASLPKDSFLTSLMSQYTPFYKAKELKPLNRRISTWEYRQVVNYAMDLGLTQGFMQQKSSAKEEYTPPFNLEGV